VKLALKVDADTLRGTREGVPRLVDLLKRYKAGATFLFSLGPDHTGRALRRVFKKNFLSKVRRTSVLEHYGIRTLLYGTLLPGPDIGRECADTMRATRDAGFEVGIHCWDHVRWQDNVASRDAAWTEREMKLACERFESVFQEIPRTWGAAGWQTNVHAARFQDQAGFAYASDTRGTRPFLPLWNGERLGCPQFPTTLPTLDELMGLAADPVSQLLSSPAKDHVFTAHAELEGGKLLGMFESLLAGWRSRRYEVVSLDSLYSSIDVAALPRHEVVYGEVAGRSGTLAVQGKEIA